MTDGSARVLIVSARGDWSGLSVADRLAARGVNYSWLDPADFPQRVVLAARFEGSWAVRLTTPGGAIDLDDVVAVFYRRPGDFEMPPGLSAPELRFARAQARVGLGGVLVSLPARWVNHPSSLADAEYKPHQLALAAAAGLVTPRTVVTNDPEVVRAFADEVGDVVVKPLAEPIIYEAGTYTPVWTRRLSRPEMSDLAGVEVTAHLFQEWVEKVYEVRLTVVGDRFFPVAIVAGSDAARIDWRSDYAALTYRRVECPDDVVAGVLRVLSASRLRYGAFDFIVDRSGQWLFLECNGSGQWGWLADECGLPVADAIADELVGGGCDG
ncbi:MAG TPA: ATP-grasp ribosomal peptide maturase [Mycobacteriales bacterium]|nr:ATP-grasp ribosomal peptide maturase [Mycobacteriales bacterium]